MTDDVYNFPTYCGSMFKKISDNLLKLTKTQVTMPHVILQFVTVLHTKSI